MKAPLRQPELTPDWSVHPGELLREVLEARQLRQSELAERTGLSAKHLSQIVTGSIGISGDVAVLLEIALGIPAVVWVRADADHEAYVARTRSRERLGTFGSWASSFDKATLQRAGITQPGDEMATKVEKILKFFRVSSPEAFEETWLKPRVSFRRSQAFTVHEKNTALWLRLVERAAECTNVGPLQPRGLRRVARTVRGMTNLPIVDGFAAARSALADVGVVLTFVREVPGTRVCGATWWLGGDRPVVGVTERHHKADIFWFSVAHELAHLLLHPRRQVFLDIEGAKLDDDGAEEGADSFAATTLLPEAANQAVLEAKTREQMFVLAAQLGVGVGILAGRHGHLTDDWNLWGSLRARITDADVEAMETISQAA
jgi:HTH-type transcriptional regulator/antitoxin HigA